MVLLPITHSSAYRHEARISAFVVLDLVFRNVVKYPNIVTDTKAVLGMRQPPQPLDAAFAGFGRLMPQMLFDGITHCGTNVGLETGQVLDRFRSQQDVASQPVDRDATGSTDQPHLPAR